MKKKNENKGFTLVELIVVLVILAILAAILVPALLGYIDRARNQQIVLNAKSYMTAAQAELSSMYGSSKKSDPTTANTDNFKKRIHDTADVKECTGFKFCTKAAATDKLEHDEFTLARAIYVQGNKAVYFDGTTWVECETDFATWNSGASGAAFDIGAPSTGSSGNGGNGNGSNGG